MPLTVNVSLNRKASRDYLLSEASINLTAALGQTRLDRLKELQAISPGWTS